MQGGAGICNLPANEPYLGCKVVQSRTLSIPGRSDVSGATRAQAAPELARAERLLAQVLTPEVRAAAGDGWPALVRDRRAHRDAAAATVRQREPTCALVFA